MFLFSEVAYLVKRINNFNEKKQQNKDAMYSLDLK